METLWNHSYFHDNSDVIKVGLWHYCKIKLKDRMDLFTPDRARERFHSLNISKSALRSANRNYVLQQIFSFPFFITSFLFFWGGVGVGRSGEALIQGHAVEEASEDLCCGCAHTPCKRQEYWAGMPGGSPSFRHWEDGQDGLSPFKAGWSKLLSLQMF